MVLEVEVRRFLDLEALDHGIRLFSFRVWVRVRFKTPNGWSPVLRALIDTGAPFSVLPSSLWMSLEYQHGFLTTLSGLVSLPSAILRAKLSQVTCTVSDLTASSPSLRIWALLAEGEVPLVLGCAGVLDRATFSLDGPHQRASLTF
jgi:hypothetical protein